MILAKLNDKYNVKYKKLFQLASQLKAGKGETHGPLEMSSGFTWNLWNMRVPAPVGNKPISNVDESVAHLEKEPSVSFFTDFHISPTRWHSEDS